jgi:hypothetical protein
MYQLDQIRRGGYLSIELLSGPPPRPLRTITLLVSAKGLGKREILISLKSDHISPS